MELALVMGAQAKCVAPQQARGLVGGYAVAVDLTSRNWQSIAKKRGEPWTLSKGCDTFTPIGELIEPQQIGDPDAIELSLQVNGSTRQHGFTKDMTFDVDELIAYVSRFMTLERGDIILTGTPAGVGPLQGGDRVTAGISTGTGFQAQYTFSCEQLADNEMSWIK